MRFDHAEPALSAQGMRRNHPTAPEHNVSNQQLHKRTVHRLEIIRGYLLGMPPEIQHVGQEVPQVLASAVYLENRAGMVSVGRVLTSICVA